MGKSTVLRAIDLIYANIIQLLSSKKKLAQLEYDDISFGKSLTRIGIEFEFEDGIVKQYSRSISFAIIISFFYIIFFKQRN